MLGKTHHAGGTVAALVAFEIMRSKNWMVPNSNEFVQLLVMYPFVSFGSIISDLDHGADSLPSKDPVAIAINKVLKFTNARHRSWQTHSIYFTGSLCLLLIALISWGSISPSNNTFDWYCLRLIFLGLVSGITSHLILDSLTTGAIYLTPKVKIRFVPKTEFFNTGGPWEKFIFKALIIIIILMVCRLFYIANMEYIQKIIEILKI